MSDPIPSSRCFAVPEVLMLIEMFRTVSLNSDFQKVSRTAYARIIIADQSFAGDTKRVIVEMQLLRYHPAQVGFDLGLVLRSWRYDLG